MDSETLQWKAEGVHHLVIPPNADLHDVLLWMWQVYGGHNDYPWYGRTYNCALEPFTGYPPAGVKNAIDNGTAYIMKPEEVVKTSLVAVAYEGLEVKGIDLKGGVKM